MGKSKFSDHVKDVFEQQIIDQFDREVMVTYRDERYLVRDNGAVYRHSQPGKRRRPLDERWTLGNPNSSGYLMHVHHVVHRIVCCAFYGDSPSKNHVVDHIDTNRQNNRAENLRWVTRMENLVNNPVTRKKIEMAFGSVDEFLKNPSAANEFITSGFAWMRPVRAEEKHTLLKRSLNWAKKKPRSTPSGILPGEWLFASQETEPICTEPTEKPSLTPGAIQRHWRIASEFPCCPKSIGDDPLHDYARNLNEGDVFVQNRFGDSLVSELAFVEDKSCLAVITQMPENGVKDWAMTKITVENGYFVHESAGTFFERQGARNALKRLSGLTIAPSEECIDDYCS